MSPQIIHAADFARDAAQFIRKEIESAIAARGLARISLCGGNTPRPVFAELARLGEDLPWEKVQITFGDERAVPPDHEQSNYRMARLALLDRIAIPEGNVFRMRGELDPAAAATEYEQKLAAVASRMGERRYTHDLLLLGLGDDGHTASLFPDTAALDETVRNVVANFVRKLDTHRITFTFPLINAARHVAFVVNDAGKRDIIQRILAGNSGYPAGRIQPEAGRLTWLLGPALADAGK